jgi:S-formylglutathione hydrolase FrmB
LDPPGTDPASLGVRYEAAQARQNREFLSRAAGLGLDVAAEIYPGSHSWPYWARELRKAFPMLLRAINAR